MYTIVEELKYAVVPYSAIGIQTKRNYYAIGILVDNKTRSTIDLYFSNSIHSIKYDSLNTINGLINYGFFNEQVLSVPYNSCILITEKELEEILTTGKMIEKPEYGVEHELFNSNNIEFIRNQPAFIGKSFYAINDLNLYNRLSSHIPNLPYDKDKKFMVYDAEFDILRCTDSPTLYASTELMHAYIEWGLDNCD